MNPWSIAVGIALTVCSVQADDLSPCIKRDAYVRGMNNEQRK